MDGHYRRVWKNPFDIWVHRSLFRLVSSICVLTACTRFGDMVRVWPMVGSRDRNMALASRDSEGRIEGYRGPANHLVSISFDELPSQRIVLRETGPENH